MCNKYVDWILIFKSFSKKKKIKMHKNQIIISYDILVNYTMPIFFFFFWLKVNTTIPLQHHYPLNFMKMTLLLNNCITINNSFFLEVCINATNIPFLNLFLDSKREQISLPSFWKITTLTEVSHGKSYLNNFGWVLSCGPVEVFFFFF